MVRCDVCGKEVLSGWICGVVPANDADKYGLCPEHDTPERRQAVQEKWERLLREKLERTLAQEKHDAEAKAQRLEVVIHFLGGGVQAVSCRAYDVNQEGDLLVLKEDNEIDFYPLQHIRRFVVKQARSAGADESGDAAVERDTDSA